MKKVYIGIIGLGNIGSAVAENIRKHRDTILENSGLDLQVKKVCDLKPKKTTFAFTRDPYAIINDPEISIVVEATGQVNPALKYILAAIRQGKQVVTPNKELMAKHMDEILTAARENEVEVRFEGAVGGGIPIIQALRESLAANNLSEIYGIVNGTTNYILTRMAEEKMELAEALARAKKMGYAEPNASADVKGSDASYKAAILAAVAFNAKVNWRQVFCEGITNITREDIQYASEIGYAIKLLAITKRVGKEIEIRVHPALVPKAHPLASVSENFNAIYVKGEPVGELMFYGQGAGGGPTASAIISDILQIADSNFKPQTSKPRNYKIRGMGEIESRYYIRLQAPDKFGVLAGIAQAFAQKKVSIAGVIQKETVGKLATIIILLHNARERDVRAALKVVKKLPVVEKISNVIRIV